MLEVLIPIGGGGLGEGEEMKKKDQGKIELKELN